MDVAALAAPADPTAAKRGEIRATAQKFEEQFLSIMLQQLFEGVNTSAPFGGGPGEQMFKSFMTEAMAKQMTRGGGIGLADTVGREMLKLQGLE
ncbi:rod-binding protein [Phenylobacterium sp.]|jgi:flagellar protein FlgJ|uniref:rod-binding protein n=1 Tax=Phenylobacterium sp. TaxID=1871053 RepID=UPI003784017A